MRKIIFTLLVLLSIESIAQKKNTGDISKSVKEANLRILEQNYNQALKSLKEAYQIDSLNANINYKIGLCYLQTSGEKDKALKYLEKASENVSHNYDPTDAKEKVAPEQTYELLGIAYRLRNQMNESNIFFAKYKELVGLKNKDISAELDYQLQINMNAVDMLLDQPKLKAVNIGDSINTMYPEYNPVLTSDGSTLYFTSRRTGGSSDEKTDDDVFFEDIYRCEKGKDGKWSHPVSLGYTVNTPRSEAVSGISHDSRELLLCHRVDEADVNDPMKADIYVSNWDGKGWASIVPLAAAINTKFNETFATLSRDANTLYFVSDKKPGTLGGKDIWMSNRLPDGSWGVATNLGPTINTPYDEESPFITADGKTLFFSSKGHKNMGGYDIFKSTKDLNGNWTEPENMRQPFNTTDDDMGYIQSSDGKYAYFSSPRKGGKGDNDIYTIKIEKPEDKSSVILGSVTFDGTTNVPDGVRITVSDKSSNGADQDISPNKTTGTFIVIVQPGKNGKTFTLNFEAPGFQSKSITATVPPNTSYEEIEKELILKPVNLESKTSGTMNIAGSIKDLEGKPIPGAQVVVKNNLTKQLISTNYTTADSGLFYFILKSGENYNLSFEAEGYLFQSANINIPKNPDYSVITKNIVLDKLTIGAKIVLNNIFFDSNKATLRPESNVEIEKLFDLMQRNPTISIEVQGHTDNKGKAAANLSLSQNRAQTIVTELIKRGIDAKRLTAKGFGQTMPIAPNTTPDGKPDEAGMQLNRRVEIKIL